MIKSIGIQNFKAIGQMAHIPLKPITLIFGPNSAGKSSIIQSLLMLKQSLGELSQNVLKAKGQYVDLGNFKEFIHNHDPDNELIFNFELIDFVGNTLNLNREWYSEAEGWDAQVQELEAVLGGEPFHMRVIIKADEKNQSSVKGFDAFLGGECADPVIEYRSSDESNIFHPNLNEKHQYWKDLLDEKMTAAKKSLKSLKSINLEEIKFDPKKFILEQIEGTENEIKNLCTTYRHFGSVSASTRISSSGFLPKYLNSSFYYDGKDEPIDESFDINDLYSEFEQPIHIYEYKDFAFYLSQASAVIQNYFENIEHIEALRKIPQRYYSQVDDSSLMKVYGSESIFTYLENNWNLNKVNEALLKINIGYRAEIRFFPEVDDDLCSINFINIHTGVASPMKDVGVGVSQVLPIVVACISGKSKTFLVEQPELHLHPAAQTELGDLFIDSALGENKNSFVIETHSEHLILRLLRRIRETADGELPEGCTPIKPEDVAVLYIQPGSDGAEVIELPVNEDGQFDRPWPDGFFAERARELF